MPILNFSSTSVERSQGATTGVLWLELSGTPFPAVGWNDFVIPIMSALVEAAASLVVGDGGPHPIHFMQGPYLLELELEPDALKLRGLRTDRGQGFVASSRVPAIDFAQEVLLAGEAALNASGQVGSPGLDEARLKQGLLRLRQCLPNP